MDKIIEDFLKNIDLPTPTPTELQKFLYQEMVRLSVLIDENTSKPQIFGLMSALVKRAKYQVNGEGDRERLAQLVQFLFEDQGFKTAYQQYFKTDHLLLNRVLRHRQATPVSMAAIMLYLASVLDLPLFAVSFPTQIILRAELREASGQISVKFLNPADGSFLSMEQLTKWLEGEAGYEAEITPKLLKRADTSELLERLETLFKMALTGEGKYEETLRIIQYRLSFNPEDPYEIRDRGMVLASMDCYHAALEDINYFIDQCPEDPSALVLKLEVAGLERQSKNVAVH
ncbi:hypothetical protein B0187_08890 [Haemophilus paracuniculus]|uniref:Protein SirB1 N-terminal domain-containing protein n=1 Tax=Haemophilus paracuniculus TaxID=734 RepID=A0A1T0AQG6_9PAST|nr:tetratricopeptide repeat protein [Haemophilus paracuniculus]OOR98374.1 hypothetical protein B0187_08890 [Haemophilus paracuniculus]